MGPELKEEFERMQFEEKVSFLVENLKALPDEIAGEGIDVLAKAGEIEYAVVLAREKGMKPLAKIVDYVTTGGKPELIMDAYRSWVSGASRNFVALPYISMHGSTQSMVTYLIDALAKRGVPAEAFELSTSDIGDLASTLVDAATVVVGTPTVLGGPHPTVAFGAFLMNALRPPVQFISAIVSYGWGGKTAEQLVEAVASLKAELISPVACKGVPKEADYAALDALADAISQKHRERNLV